MTKSNTCLFTTVLCLIPENVSGRPLKKKKKGNGLAAGCQLLYSKRIFFAMMEILSQNLAQIYKAASDDVSIETPSTFLCNYAHL